MMMPSSLGVVSRTMASMSVVGDHVALGEELVPRLHHALGRWRRARRRAGGTGTRACGAVPRRASAGRSHNCTISSAYRWCRNAGLRDHDADVGVTQQMVELAGLGKGVERHRDAAGHRGTEHRRDPLGSPAREHTDPGTPADAGGDERLRDAASLVAELGVRPRHPVASGDVQHHGLPIAVPLRDLVEERAERECTGAALRFDRRTGERRHGASHAVGDADRERRERLVTHVLEPVALALDVLGEEAVAAFEALALPERRRDLERAPEDHDHLSAGRHVVVDRAERVDHLVDVERRRRDVAQRQPPTADTVAGIRQRRQDDVGEVRLTALVGHDARDVEHHSVPTPWRDRGGTASRRWCAAPSCDRRA